MEKTLSVEDIQHVQPEGTLLLIRKFAKGSPKRAVFIIPDVGESLTDGFYDRLAETIISDDMVVYVVELRGHSLSEGTWSLHAYRTDVAFLIAYLRKKHEHLYVVGMGLSASTLLEYDDQAHTFRGQMPPLPSGMLLLSPLFKGGDMLPSLGKVSRAARTVLPAATPHLVARALRKKKGVGYGHCRLDRKNAMKFWEDISSYGLNPVRIQTPTVMLVPMDEHADPLKRIFGTVSIRRVDWLHHFRKGKLSRVEVAHHLKEIKKDFERVLGTDRPIRFRTVK